MPKIQGVNHRRAVKALRKAGFTVVREGKHIVMSDGSRILISRAPIRSTLSPWAALFEMLV